MEIFSKVTRQFRVVFQKQQHMNTFKTYDSVDVRFTSLNYVTDLHLTSDLTFFNIIFQFVLLLLIKYFNVNV